MTRLCLTVLLAVGITGCGAPYLLRAACEEARILWRREPITKLLAREDLEPELRRKLELVLATREFAHTRLELRVGRSYATFAPVGDDAVVYVVTAAYRDRLEPYTWRYPIVGTVPYRGFFAESRARDYAAMLEERGLDTAVWPTVAFSTLGWFGDPLLPSMLERDAVDLVTVVFHELTHAQLYVRSAARFNESFANFVGHRAAIAFFCDGSGKAEGEGSGEASSTHSDRCHLAESGWRAELAYAGILAQLEATLRGVYANAGSEQERDAEREKALRAATDDLAKQRSDAGRYQGTDLTRFNNAVLVQQLLYRQALDRFDEIWEEENRNLRRTVRHIIETARDSKDPFRSLGGATNRDVARVLVDGRVATVAPLVGEDLSSNPNGWWSLGRGDRRPRLTLVDSHGSVVRPAITRTQQSSGERTTGFTSRTTSTAPSLARTASCLL